MGAAGWPTWSRIWGCPGPRLHIMLPELSGNNTENAGDEEEEEENEGRDGRGRRGMGGWAWWAVEEICVECSL